MKEGRWGLRKGEEAGGGTWLGRGDERRLECQIGCHRNVEKGLTLVENVKKGLRLIRSSQD